MKHLLIIAAVAFLFAFHAGLLPIIARDVLHSGAAGYALLTAATAPGAILGALVAGEIVTDRWRRVALGGGMLLSGLMFVGIALSRSVMVTAACLAGNGFAVFLVNSTAQSVVLTISPDEYRGRVMGLFAMMSFGAVPIAALAGGLLGSYLGAPGAVAVGATCVLGYSAWLISSGTLAQIGIGADVGLSAQRPGIMRTEPTA